LLGDLGFLPPQSHLLVKILALFKTFDLTCRPPLLVSDLLAQK
jgi:hypothetical protein